MTQFQSLNMEESLLQEMAKRLTLKTGLTILGDQSASDERGQLVPLQVNVLNTKNVFTLYLAWSEPTAPDSMVIRLLEILALETYNDLFSPKGEKPDQDMWTWERLMEKGEQEQWDRAEFIKQAKHYSLPVLLPGYPVYIQCVPWHPKIQDVLSNLYPHAQVSWCHKRELFLWIPVQGISLSDHELKAQGEEMIQEVYSLLADELGVSTAVLIGDPTRNNVWEGYLEVKALSKLHARFFAGEPGLTSWKTGLAALFGTLQTSSAQQYIEMLLGVLSDELMETLIEFLQHDLSIGDTARALFIHRNTLTYRIDKITELTGYNPRQLTGAVYFYLAIWLKKHMRY